MRHHRAGDGELGDVLGDSHPVVGRGEAHPVQHAVGLGQKVLAPVGGMVLGDGGDDGFGGIGEDRLAEVVASEAAAARCGP